MAIFIDLLGLLSVFMAPHCTVAYNMPSVPLQNSCAKGQTMPALGLVLSGPNLKVLSHHGV